MPSIEDTRQNLCDWIETVHPAIPVRLADANAGQPDEPFITVKLIHLKWRPHPRQTLSMTTDYETVNGHSMLHYSIQAIGGGDPESTLQRIVNSFATVKGEMFLHTSQMGYCGITANIESIATLVGVDWEERAVMTAMFDAIIPDTYITDYATSAEIELLVKNEIENITIGAV